MLTSTSKNAMSTDEELRDLQLQIDTITEDLLRGYKLLELLGKYCESLNSEELNTYAEALINIGTQFNKQKFTMQGYYYKGRTLLSSEPENARSLFQLALTLVSEDTTDKEKGDLYQSVGSSYFLQSNYPAAKENYKSALNFRKKVGSNSAINSTLNSLGNCCSFDGNYSEAVEYYQKSLAIIAPNDSKKIGICHGNLANVNFIISNYPEGVYHALKAEDFLLDAGDTKTLGNLYNTLGSICGYQGDKERSLKYLEKAIPLRPEHQLGESYFNIGNAYLNQAEYDLALENYNIAFTYLKPHRDEVLEGKLYEALGILHSYKENWPVAIEAFKKAIDILENAVSADMDLCAAYSNAGRCFIQIADYENANHYLILAGKLNETLNIKKLKVDLLEHWCELKKAEGKVEEASSLREKYHDARDQLYSEETGRRFEKNFADKNSDRKERQIIMEQSKREEVEKLLYRILPRDVAVEILQTGDYKSRASENVTVLFTDVKGYSKIAQQVNRDALIQEVKIYFDEFDRIISKYGIEKIKIIGDSYMAAAGLRINNQKHAEEMVRAAIEMRNFVLERKLEIERMAENKSVSGIGLEIRIGIHSGPITDSIMGEQKFAYDIYGNTVDIASRMESSCDPGKVNISETTYLLVRDKFKCIGRGKVDAKNIGPLPMYYVE